MTLTKYAGLAAAVAIALPTTASAVTERFFANVQEINDSGVSGRVDFTVDTDAMTLAVRANIMGLTPGDLHINHIHGRFDDAGNPRDSVSPTLAEDAVENGGDGDGLIEVFEGASAYGDVLLSLEPNPTMDSNHNGPVDTDGDGIISYDLTFSLEGGPNDPFFSTVGGPDYGPEDIMPLNLREYVIHGGFVDGEGFRASLPVGVAEIAPVPVPAAGMLLAGALGGLGLMRRRKSA